MTHWILVHRLVDGTGIWLNTACIAQYGKWQGFHAVIGTTHDPNTAIYTRESVGDLNALIREAEHDRPNGGVAAIGEDV